jgi:hypothetical protein
VNRRQRKRKHKLAQEHTQQQRFVTKPPPKAKQPKKPKER